MTAVAISGTRRAMRELADGTIRVQIDVDPRFRRDFLLLFSEIDCGVAMVPLAAGVVEAPPENTTEAPPPAKDTTKSKRATVEGSAPGGDQTAATSPTVGGSTPPGSRHKSKFPEGLTGLAVRWCQDNHFQRWLGEAFPDEWALSSGHSAADRAADAVRQICDIESRNDLNDGEGAEVFKHQIMAPYKAKRALDEVDKEPF